MRFLIKKTIALFATLLVAAFLTFLAFSVIPSDPAIAKLGMDATEEQIEAKKEELGLNRPLLVRYGEFLKNAVRGDFGESTQYRMPVGKLLSQRLGVTFGLALYSFILIFVFSFPLGILSVRHSERSNSGLWTFITQLMMAIPPFFLGMIFSLVFGVILRLFTPGGYVSPGKDFGGFISFMFFPALSVAIPKIGMTVRFFQSSVGEQMQADYVRTAKSKGCGKKQVLLNHVLRNSLVPVVTFLIMIMAEILAGSVVIEQVFNLSGVGRLLVVSISNRDYPVVRAIVLYATAVVILLNYTADLICRKLDPRIQEI